MTLSDLIAFSALIVSIFALPISYILGARGLKITDHLVSDNLEVRNTAMRGLIYKLDALKTFFTPKFI